MLHSPALHIEHVVDDDPVEPGAEAASAFERREAGHHFDQDLLRRVLGVLRMEEHANRDVVDPPLMTLDQVFKRLAITRAGAHYETLILVVGWRVVGQRTIDS